MVHRKFSSKLQYTLWHARHCFCCSTVLGYYFTKMRKSCALETCSPPAPGISLHPGTLSTFHRNFSSFRAQRQKCFATSHYFFYLRFAITHYPENINNKKMLIAVICTDTGQLSQSIQQQEIHLSHHSDKSY